jgi:hypothetical protein
MAVKLSSLDQEDVDAIVERAAKASGEDPILVRQVLTISTALEEAMATQLNVMRDRFARLKSSVTPG